MNLEHKYVRNSFSHSNVDRECVSSSVEIDVHRAFNNDLFDTLDCEATESLIRKTLS